MLSQADTWPVCHNGTAAFVGSLTVALPTATLAGVEVAALFSEDLSVSPVLGGLAVMVAVFGALCHAWGQHGH